ncbi:MAG: DUF814 domain-containing protein [Holophagaceae bacterium]|nr:DUF814 domain-containing protein [Holophagaceae bacterium]
MARRAQVCHLGTMDAPLLLALARHRLALGASVDAVHVSHRALLMVFSPSKGSGRGWTWVFLLHPGPRLWLVREGDEACRILKAEAKVELSRRWGLELKGARLEAVHGDPRERWLGLDFRRRVLTGRIEGMRLAFQAIPGRAGLRLDGLDLNAVRIGMGSPFPAVAPVPDHDPPPLLRWKDAFPDRLELALSGALDEILDGEGDLAARHHAWSLAQAEHLLLNPAKVAVDRRLVSERARLDRLGEALKRDLERHRASLGSKSKASRLSAELYRLKGAPGHVELLDGSTLDLPPGLNAEAAAQRWYSAAKRAERGLAKVAQLEAERLRQLKALDLGAAPPTEKPKNKTPMNQLPKREDKQPNRRADGKGLAFRSVVIDGFEVLIGKGDADNDRLTFKVAAPLDWWLHVAGVPGSHVIIRNPDKLGDAPREVLERAAELAAFHSKARDGGKVEVHLCRVADVSKPRGFEPGKVMLKQWKALRVYPKA